MIKGNCFEKKLFLRVINIKIMMKRDFCRAKLQYYFCISKYLLLILHILTIKCSFMDLNVDYLCR